MGQEQAIPTADQLESYKTGRSIKEISSHLYKLSEEESLLHLTLERLSTKIIVQKTIIVVLDVSGSMAGSRLRNCKQVIAELINTIFSDFSDVEFKFIFFSNFTRPEGGVLMVL